MKAAIDIAPWRAQPARTRQATDAAYKAAGLLIAVGFPTLFWVTALSLLTKPLGISMSAAGLTGIGLVIAAICFVGSALVMGERR
jgi:hypothetical protein